LFDVVFVRAPADSYINCVSTNPDRSSIDLNVARKQHREYVSILKESRVTVVELPPLSAFPDSVFMQDPAVLGRTCAVIGRFGEPKRRGEEDALIHDLTGYKGTMGQMRRVNAPGTLEGGDIVVTDRGIFVGESSRTNSLGINQLSTFLMGVTVKAVKSELFHLLCGCSYLNDGNMIIAPELIEPASLPGFRLVTIPKEEAYACDALYVGDGRVIIPAGYAKASSKLKQAGYKPIEVDVSEFHKGDGGVTCLSSPIYKVF
jgi:dimethylargininase